MTRRKQGDPLAFDPDRGMRHTYTARLMPYLHEMLDQLCGDLILAQDEGGLDRRIQQLAYSGRRRPPIPTQGGH